MFRPLRERNYRLWAAADVVSVCGTWMQVLGLNWLVLTVTGSATAMGVSVLLQALPSLLFAGLGGALADRLPARPVLIVTQLVRVALSLTLAAAVVGGVDSLWPVYLVTFASGIIGSLEGPVLARFGSALVGRETLGSALALGSVLSSGGRILGMALGGVVAGLVGPAPLFLFNAVSFLGVVAAIAAVRSREMYPLAVAATGSPDSGVRAGLRYLLTQPVILVVLGLSFVLGSLGRNYQLTMAAMSAGPLASGAGGYGLLSTVFAVGGVLGGLVAAAQPRMSLRLLLLAGGGISVLQLASGFAPGLFSFAAAILPIAAGAVIVDTVVSARIQLDTREEMRGRMVAALGLVSSLAGMVGAPTLGWLCDSIGPRAGLAVAGVITTVGCLVAAMLLRRMTGVSLLPVLRWSIPGRRPVPANAA
jgi:MFS family permease